MIKTIVQLVKYHVRYKHAKEGKIFEYNLANTDRLA